MPTRTHTLLLAAIVAAICLALPASSLAQATGGAAYQPPAKKARVVNGKAIAPADAPEAVKKIIEAANRIVNKPYKYGGGHAKVSDTGYDCSGTVSFALIRAGLLKTPLDSSDFLGYGEAGKGHWVTVYTNPGHAYMVVAGLRLDTGYRDRYVAKWGGAPGSGPRWAKPRDASKFTARHPAGL
jgi:hypothetical protein